MRTLSLPDAPGVYFFRGPRRSILYIGKAASLSDRVRSYFSGDLAASRSPAIAGMVARAKDITWEETDSVLEALILEANYIKKYQPPYNVEQKDNKSWNYLCVTREKFPQVLVVRGRELFGTQGTRRDMKAIFGPYPHGGSLREALRIVRKIFPFRDASCTPCDEQMLAMHTRRPSKRKTLPTKVKPLAKVKPLGGRADECRPCFNRHIGLCPGVCTGEVTAAEYAGTIKNIRELFAGKKRSLVRRLQREMRAAAKSEDYEHAATLRTQVEALEHIRDVSLIKNDAGISTGGSFRVEAYDVAHTSGAETVGVMTVVSGGEAMKSAYRMFKVRGVKNDDAAALREILSRRLVHTEWQLPRVVVVDGGKAQLRSAERLFREVGVSIPVVAVVKDERHRQSRIIGDEGAIRASERDILLANREAHRFALSYHRKRRAHQGR